MGFGTWAILAMFFPSVATLTVNMDNSDKFMFATMLALSILAYGGTKTPNAIHDRVSCAYLLMFSVLWMGDNISGYLFDVQIHYPWWAVIELAVLLVLCASVYLRKYSFYKHHDGQCFVYQRKPRGLVELFIVALTGGLVQYAVEYRGKFYAFRKGYLRKIDYLDTGVYERRYCPSALGAKLERSVGRKWRPWFNCVVALG